MKPIQQIYPELSHPRKVVITMHQKPDPDAMGSALGLYHFLVQLGHRVTVISPTNWADFLNWMPGCRLALDYEGQREKSDALLDEADWVFCLDFNALHRTKHMARKLESVSADLILMDHHEEPHTHSFQFGTSVIPKSSTAEMVYDFIRESGYGHLINTDIAQCLYAGVMSDTGSFRFPVTTPSVHLMVAELKKTGLNHSKVHEEIYDNFLENRLRFIGHVLVHRMEIFYEYNTALIAIPKGDLQKFHIRTGDTEGLVNYPLSIQGIKMAALLIDRDEERRWSFRSKEGFDCNNFARKYFEGGGHYNAAGGRSGLPMEDNIRNFREAIRENASQLQ
jgi:phosphoesterase RecJ-like protein